MSGNSHPVRSNSALIDDGGLSFLPEWTASGVAIYLIATLYFYLPISMTGRYAIHKFVDPAACWAFLAYPETWTIVFLGVLTLRVLPARRLWNTLRGDRSFLLLVGLGFSFALLCAVTSVVQGSEPDFFIRKISMEWLLPLALGVVLRAFWSERLDREIMMALISGTLLLCCVGIVTYFASFGIPSSFSDHIYWNRTYLIWRGMAGGVSFGELPMGGVNVLAGHVSTILCLVFAALAAARRRSRRVLFLSFVVVASIVEWLCFSRGVLLFLFALVPVFLLLNPSFRRSSWCRWSGLVMFALLLACIAPLHAADYWLGQLTLQAGSTSRSRLQQMETILDVERISKAEVPEFAAVPLDQAEVATRNAASPREGPSEPVPGSSRENSSSVSAGGSAARRSSGRVGQKRPLPVAAKPIPAPRSQVAEAAARERIRIASRIGGWQRRLWLGYGLGHYGVLRGLVRDSGTHNIFLNALVDAGIFGILLFLAFFAVAVHRRFLAWMRVAGSHPRGVIELGRLLALVSIVFVGATVDYRLENLGTMIGAGVLWSLLAAPSSSEAALDGH